MTGSGRPIYEPTPDSHLAGHRYDIERLYRRTGGGGIAFNFDNEGGWLYAAVNDPLVLGTDVPAMAGDPLASPSAGNTWGGVLLDTTGHGLLFEADDADGSSLAGIAFQVTVAAHDTFPATAGWMNLADDHLEISLKRDTGKKADLWASPDYFQFTFSPSGSDLYLDGDRFGVDLPSSGIQLDDAGESFAVRVAGTFHIEVTSGDLAFHAASGRNILMTTLPTSDPGVSGALWNSAGTVKVSP